MSDIKQAYAASSALTFTSLASLASDANLLAGAEAAVVDNSSNKYEDYLLSGRIHTGTSPTTGKEIRVYVFGLLEDGTYMDVLDGTDSAETLSGVGTRDSAGMLAACIPTIATSDLGYYFGPVSVAALFGGVLPLKLSVFVTHNTGVALKSSGHALYVTPIYRTVA